MNTNGRSLDVFDTMLHNVFRPLAASSLRGFPAMDADDREPGMVRMDVAENDRHYLIQAELPGLRKEDVNVAINGNRVVISGECRHEKSTEDQGERMLWSERYVGRFERSFQLPQAIDENTAEAKYVDGVLHLTLPKKEAKGTRCLEIH